MSPREESLDWSAMTPDQHMDRAATILRLRAEQEYVNRAWVAAQTHLLFAIAKQLRQAETVARRGNGGRF